MFVVTSLNKVTLRNRIKRKKILRMMRLEASNFQGKLAPIKIITIKERYNIPHPPGKLKLLIQDRFMSYKREEPARASRGNYRRLVILSQMFNLMRIMNRIKTKLAQ